jgi:hypothetical protein
LPLRSGNVSYLHDASPMREWMIGLRDGQQGMSGKQDYLSYLEKLHHLPDGLLDEVWSTESGRGKNAGFSKAGALGDFQFMEGTGKEYGLKDDNDRRDFFKSARAASALFEDELYRTRGDLKKALAGYNWGDKHLSDDLKANGANWEAHLPSETQNYIKKIMSTLAKRQAVKVNVSVTNSTASRVAVSANAGAIS